MLLRLNFVTPVFYLFLSVNALLVLAALNPKTVDKSEEEIVKHIESLSQPHAVSGAVADADPYFQNRENHAHIYNTFKAFTKKSKWYLPIENIYKESPELILLAKVSKSDEYILNTLKFKGLAERAVCKALLVASHNNFQEGVDYLLKKFKGLTLEGCRKNVPVLRSPLTLNLLLATIYYGNTKDLLETLTEMEFFVADQFVMVQGLIHAVHLKKTSLFDPMANHGSMKEFFASSPKAPSSPIIPGLIYSLEYIREPSFFEYLADKLKLDKNFLFETVFVDLCDSEQNDLIFNSIAGFSDYFKTMLLKGTVKNLYRKWNPSPEALFYVASNINIRVFSLIERSSLRTFAAKKYKDRDPMVLQKANLAPLPDVVPSNDADSFLVAFLKTNYKTLDASTMTRALDCFKGKGMDKGIKLTDSDEASLKSFLEYEPSTSIKQNINQWLHELQFDVPQ